MNESDQDLKANHPAVRGSYRRMIRRPFVLAAPVALLLLVSACGDDASTPAADEPSATGDAPAAAAGSVLTGSVGEGDKPVITLTDSTGAPVTTLKAGSYEVKVKDLSAKHNFHLTGTGVEEKTTVPETTEATWTVTFVAGSYTFKCDPHPPMTGTFTVT